MKKRFKFEKIANRRVFRFRNRCISSTNQQSKQIRQKNLKFEKSIQISMIFLKIFRRNKLFEFFILQKMMFNIDSIKIFQILIF